MCQSLIDHTMANKTLQCVPMKSYKFMLQCPKLEIYVSKVQLVPIKIYPNVIPLSNNKMTSTFLHQPLLTGFI